jgi:N-acetylneuraminate synthase
MRSDAEIAFEAGGRLIGRGAPPLIIAEMSGNHNQSLDRALEIVDAAAQAGAHAIKLQTYTADTMTLDVRRGEFIVGSAQDLWKGRTLYDLYKEAHTPWEWHRPILDRCRRHGILGFSTPFDESAVDFLEGLDVPLYKIASFELTDLPLIARVAQTGKPMVMSTGMATVAEIDEAVTTVRSNGCTRLILLKCTSTYPASPENSNVLTIPHLRTLFGCEVGLSDHTMGVGVAVAAVAHGATVVEKHFTLRRADGGVDSAFSLEPAELRMLAEETERAWRSLGRVMYGPTEAERESMVFRRSIYVAQDVGQGEPFTRRNLRRVRPGLGLAPKHYEELLGRTATRAICKGTPMSWSLVE